jgi:hypothetical protein
LVSPNELATLAFHAEWSYAVDRYGNPASNTGTHRESELLMGIAGMLDESPVGPASLASSSGDDTQLLKYPYP